MLFLCWCFKLTLRGERSFPYFSDFHLLPSLCLRFLDRSHNSHFLLLKKYPDIYILLLSLSSTYPLTPADSRAGEGKSFFSASCRRRRQEGRKEGRSGEKTSFLFKKTSLFWYGGQVAPWEQRLVQSALLLLAGVKMEAEDGNFKK